ncbi:SDR family NAD(P)-dependent oxidoreductase [Demequina iriomotensis]|uniref:SDR family NAD(P)-dependent oxidoreductase n=1 Tax=Demequina iriomotensis TaxID=1536641 RepID=UPI000AAE5BD3|nr:SDR family oxidoreductase [Demequina iriomotensis]
MTGWLDLTGKGALVVGAGGLGGASALSLARQGMATVVVDRDTAALDRVATAAADAGHALVTLVADISTPEACRAVVAESVARVGAPRAFVHAVGRNDRRPVLELGDADWESIVTLNLSTAWWLGQEVGRRMVAEGCGRMVFVSSVSAHLAHAHHAPYAATKGGINQMMRVMAREWASHGVTVNAVGPGYVETDLTRAYLDRDGHREELEALVPARRLGDPAEVADAVTFLLSDRARFITGQCLYVDGGRTLV